jgi:Mg-chelatase subunit ChlD
MKYHKLACVLLILTWFLVIAGNLEAQEVLFKSNYTDLKANWEVVDDPKADRSPARWRFGLAEFSGIHNRDQTIATALLAGERDWSNYTVETSLHMASSQGYLVGIICGYQDPEHFYVIGYNFYQRRFELFARTSNGFELLASHKVDFPELTDVLLHLDYAGERLRFSAEGRLIFDINDGRYSSGGFGLGVSGLQGSRVMIGHVTVTSLDPSVLPPREIQDLLILRKGAEVVSKTEEDAFKALIDRILYLDKEENQKGSSMTINAQRNVFPIEGIFAFPQEKSVEIHSIGLQLGPRYFPREIEFLVSEQSPDSEFKSLGTFQIKPEKDSYQEFAFDRVRAKYLKIRLLSLSEATDRYVQIDEMFVKGFREDSGPIPGAPKESSFVERGKVLFADDFSSGSLDKWEIWNDPEAYEKESQWRVVLSEFSNIYNELDHPATFLVTGQINWADYSVQTDLNAVHSDGNLSGPVFGFQDPENYFIAGYNFHWSRFELGVRTTDGFQILARAAIDYPRSQWLPLQVDVSGTRILVRFNGKIIFDIDNERPIAGRVGIGTSSLDSGDINFSDFQVVSLDKATLPQRELQDLLSSRRGAAVIYRESIPKGETFDDMLDHRLLEEDNFGNTYNIQLSEDPLPQEAVFCFPQGRFVEVHRIGFKLHSRAFPREIKFWVSNQTPKSGFSPLATLAIEPKRDSYQEFDVPPTRAKYLKMQISQGDGSETVDIHEMFVKGNFLEIGTKQQEGGRLGEVQIQEKETNDTKEQAQPLPLNTYLGGKVSREDVDYFKLSLKDQPGNTLTLTINNIGMMRPGYALLTDEGTVIEPSNEVAVANTTKVTYDIVPGDCFLRIDRPDSYLTIVFDDSGSMGSSVGIVKRILGGYLNNLGEGLNLQLMKYEDEPHFLSDFTHDAAMLKQAMEKEVRGGGGTDTFSGLGAAVKSVQKKEGNRAVLAIFDVIDCSGNDCLQYYVDLWDAILDSGISFSTIAVQSGWDTTTSYFGNTRQRIFKEIAFASNGQFYFSPTDEKVEKSADIIFRQLTSPVEYRIRAELTQTERKPGLLAIRFEKGAERKTSQNVELILDASNSMWGQIKGEAKITIAKKVLAQIIQGLPAEMNVGLRIYGHRYGLNDKRACSDTELVVPIGQVDKEQLIETVNNISPRGKTPLVYSVLQSIKDFEDLENGTGILISDGIESCDGDIDAIAPAIKEAGLALQVHIVGFDIKEVEARKQLEAIAKSTGGVYLDAKDSQELLSSLEKTLKVEFVLVDDGGEIAARGIVGGESIQVLEGSYTLRLLLQPKPLEMSVTIRSGGKTTLTLKKDAEKWELIK